MKQFAWLVAALIAAPGTTSAQQSPARDSLTLEEVVARALEVSPGIVQASSSVTTAQSSERAALGSYLPSLSLTSGAGLASTERFNPTTNTTVTGSSDSYSAGLSAGIDLFTGGRRGAERDRAGAVSDAAEATLIERTFAVTLEAKQAYFDVAKAGELARVAQARLQRAAEGLSAAERRLQVGTATRSDVLRAQLEQTNAKQALLTAQAQERSGSFALARVVGSQAPVYPRVSERQAPRPLALSEAELVQLVVEQAPAVLSAEANYDAARASASAAHAAYLPTLRLSGGYNWFNQEAALSGGNLSWTTQVSLSYPLFNGFAREDNIARAEANARNASAAAADARLKARADLERVMNALELAGEQVALSRQAVEVAREDLRVQQERYKLGMSTILDRITSQVNLMDAENREVAARYDYEIARAQLEALIGRQL
ncbi:MAG: TolC family protein [Gemmatimonadota bacterium]